MARRQPVNSQGQRVSGHGERGVHAPLQLIPDAKKKLAGKLDAAGQQPDQQYSDKQGLVDRIAF